MEGQAWQRGVTVMAKGLGVGGARKKGRLATTAFMWGMEAAYLQTHVPSDM